MLSWSCARLVLGEEIATCRDEEAGGGGGGVTGAGPGATGGRRRTIAEDDARFLAILAPRGRVAVTRSTFLPSRSVTGKLSETSRAGPRSARLRPPRR